MDLRPRADYPTGEVLRLEHRSVVLEGNPWNDPVEREVAIYLPHDYRDSPAPFISLWDLAAYTNSGPGHLNWKNQGENLVQRLDRLIGTGKMPPAVVVIPDCYTSLGGNQYVNSAAVGRYADYVVEELIPFVEQNVNVVPERTGRGVFGKSSGGFGALHLAMEYPQAWAAVASLAGDVGFELVYRPEFPVAAGVLARFDGDAHAFMRSFWRKNRPGGPDYGTMMTLAMAASYDPDPADPTRIRLPFDLRTCRLDAARWANWAAFDPLNRVADSAEALKNLAALIIEVGLQDQYNIQYGSRQLVDEFDKHGIPCTYREFEGSHSSIDWRLDHILPDLALALKNESFGSS